MFGFDLHAVPSVVPTLASVPCMLLKVVSGTRRWEAEMKSQYSGLRFTNEKRVEGCRNPG